MTHKLLEGMRAGDLAGLIANTISIDEYKSKVDDSAVVIAFTVSDRVAAHDLNRFVQKSSVQLLDSEVSAVPNQRGDYLLFVELVMNESSGEAVASLARDVSLLGGFTTWKVKLRGEEVSKPMSVSGVKEYIIAKMNLMLRDFFTKSNIPDVTVDESNTVVSESGQVSFALEDFGSFERVVQRQKLHETTSDRSSSALAECARLRESFGANWSVEKIGDRFAVYDESANQLAVIRLTLR